MANLESSTTNFSCFTPGGLAAPKAARASWTLSLQTWMRYAHTTNPVLLKPARKSNSPSAHGRYKRARSFNSRNRLDRTIGTVDPNEVVGVLLPVCLGSLYDLGDGLCRRKRLCYELQIPHFWSAHTSGNGLTRRCSTRLERQTHRNVDVTESINSLKVFSV